MKYYTEIHAYCDKCETQLVPFVSSLGTMLLRPCCECALPRVTIRSALDAVIFRGNPLTPMPTIPADPAVQNVERALDATKGSLDGKTVDTSS